MSAEKITKNPSGNLDSAWFRRVFFISFFLCGLCFIVGNVFQKYIKEKPLKMSLTKEASDFEGLVFPPFPVNLKTQDGIVPALVRIELKTDKASAAREILKKNKKFKKHLLLLLSGRNKVDLKKNSAYFEAEIRSQFNVFLSRGAVEKVKIHTKLIN